MELDINGAKINNRVLDLKRDYSGTTFCHLTALSPCRILENGDIASYNCKCKRCGKKISVDTENLFFYKTRSCGCTDKFDLVGGIFSNLTVIRSAGIRKEGKNGSPIRVWLCRCKCGKEIIVSSGALAYRHAKSCGCLRVSQATKYTELTDRSINHRLSIIKQRCYNPKDKQYFRYGARGIYVCDEWMKDSQNFVDWFKSQSNWSTKLEVDRIDGDGPYAPWNCRLATRETQLINRKCTHFVVVDGIKLTGSQWSNLLRLTNRLSLYSFIHHNGKEKTIQFIRSKMHELGITRDNLHEFIQFEHFDPITNEENHV